MQPLAQSERPLFSWKKGALHAFAAAAALGVLTLIAAAGLTPQASYQFGRAIARDLLWTFAFAFVATYGFQTRRKVLGWVMLILTVIVVGADGTILFQTAHRLTADNAPLTAAEKARPARDARQPRLCQAALGVSFPDPGKAFAPATALEERLRAQETDPKVAKWVWESSETENHIILRAMRGLGTEQGFRDFAADFTGSLAKTPGVKMAGESLHWTGERGEYDLTADMENGIHLQSHCLARGRKGDLPPLTACLQTFTGEGDPLRDIRNGLDVRGCGK
jgi:hypothetical protein